MKITPKNQETRKFQVGGAMPAGAPAEDPSMPGIPGDCSANARRSS